MCLAIPAQLREKKGTNLAIAEVMGATRTISLDLTPAAEVGDWVLMHAGFAIEIVDEQFANETLELLRALPFAEEEAPPPATFQTAAKATAANA
ncbi:MAG: HypC/HybG/HupF family hydrogenase formation chaperone [Actinomycetes bacterium]|jgi:hydrogenase expression/formation protein HypC|nr:HypC/HybG/HupF family hydrogenase formation chaperone [Actinomycetes bacterium]